MQTDDQIPHTGSSILAAPSKDTGNFLGFCNLGN
jgi:hypothetical protein